MSDTHPAVLASENAAKFAMAGDRDSWLDLYAEDAILANPVGKSPFNPKGEGFRGKAEIKRYWDTVIGKANLTIVASQRIVCGNTCAAVLQVTNDFGGGMKATMDQIAIYEVNDDGKLISVKHYWDWDKFMAQIKELGAG